MVSNAMYSEEDDSQDEPYVNYKQKYRELKKNLRHLLYENECFQDELRKAQRNFVNISRDKSFLLDRILKYEKPQGPSSDSEATESSDEDEEAKMPQANSHVLNQRKKITKRKKSDGESHNGNIVTPSSSDMTGLHSHGTKPTPVRSVAVKQTAQGKKSKKPTTRKPSTKRHDSKDRGSEKGHLNPHIMKNYHLDNMHMAHHEQVNAGSGMFEGMGYEFPAMSSSHGGHMTREEVERHLESRRFSPELNTTATVPAELFSHEPDPESDFEDSEMCEYIQLEEDGQSGEMMME